MTETSKDHAALDLALKTGAALGDAKAAGVHGCDYAVLPKGYDLHGLERFFDRPARRRGVASFKTESSFCDYVKRYQSPTTLAFADFDGFSMTAVLDYHDAVVGDDGAVVTGGPHWGQHRAVCRLPHDPDWETWTKHNDKPMSQIDFAQFVEDNMPAIVEPDGATLLELVQDLEAKNKVTFKGAQRLHDGSRSLQYEETTQQKLCKGNIEMPESFKLRLKVFRWGDLWDLEAKLRYRIDGGHLILFYHLHRPQDVADAAFRRVLEQVQVETGLRPMTGQPPSEAEIAGAAG